MTILFTASFFLLAPGLLLAQYEFQPGVAPGMGYDPYYNRRESTAPAEIPLDSFAQVLADEYLQSKPTDFWTTIGVSSEAARQEMSLYVRRGFGRLEIIALSMICEKSGQKLKDITRKRLRGARLRELAAETPISYEELRLQARELKDRIVRSLPAPKRHSNGTVESSTRTASERRSP